MKVSVWGTLVLLAWPLMAVANGCSSQHEGERCDKTNGDVDCDPGLYCKTVYVQQFHYICCPIPPALASVSTCNASGSPTPPVSDAGTDADADVGDDADVTTQNNGAAETTTKSAASTPAAY
jgi:hypothetical protein